MSNQFIKTRNANQTTNIEISTWTYIE